MENSEFIKIKDLTISELESYYNLCSDIVTKKANEAMANNTNLSSCSYFDNTEYKKIFNIYTGLQKEAINRLKQLVR